MTARGGAPRMNLEIRWARPSARDLDAALRPRKANTFRFKDDGVIPNNPKLPLVLYRSPVRLLGK